jgi:hypothetical protein
MEDYPRPRRTRSMFITMLAILQDVQPELLAELREPVCVSSYRFAPYQLSSRLSSIIFFRDFKQQLNKIVEGSSKTVTYIEPQR